MATEHTRRVCNSCGDPELDESAIDCEGEYYPAGCVILEKNTYLGIVQGDRLTNLIDIISRRFKAISRALSGKLDYRDLYDSGDLYIDDADASLNGVQKGEPYIDTIGHLRIRIN